VYPFYAPEILREVPVWRTFLFVRVEKRGTWMPEEAALQLRQRALQGCETTYHGSARVTAYPETPI